MPTNKETTNPTSSLLVRELEKMSSGRLPIYFEIVEALENLDRHKEIFPRLSKLLELDAFKISREVSLYSRTIREKRKDNFSPKPHEFILAEMVLEQINSLATPKAELKDPLISAEEKITRASFMGALYSLATKNGMFDTLWDIMTRFDAKNDFRQVIELDLEVALAIENLIDETVKDLQKIFSPEAPSINQLNQLVSCLSDEVETEIWKSFKGITTGNERILKRQKERRGLIAHLIAVSLIVAGVGAGTMHLVERGEENKPMVAVSTDSLPPILKTPPPLLETTQPPPTPKPERKPTPTVAATATETIPIPKQITVDKDKGGKVAAPEISIEKNEAFHVVEPGDWLSKIVKEYWYPDALETMIARFSRVLLMINPHLGNDPNKIEVGKRVFVYPEQMKGKFAEVLAFLLEGKGKLEDLRKLIKDLAIPTIYSQNEFVSVSEKGEWVIYDNKEQLTLEKILRQYFGAFGEKSLALINRINHMKMDGQDVVPLLVLPPEGWLSFQIENNSLPPAIIIPQIPIEQPEISRPAPTPTKEAPSPAPLLTHIVKNGETLSAIAQRYGTTVAAIATANDIANPDKISVGRRLIIPDKKNPLNVNVYKDTPKTTIPSATLTKEPAKGTLPAKIDPGQSLDQLGKKGPPPVQDLIQQYQQHKGLNN